MPEFEGVPEEIRKLIPREVMDVGGGKAMMIIDDEMVEACRQSRDQFEEVLRKAIDMSQNIKDNGADFDESWASFLVLSKHIDSLSAAASVTLAFLLTKLVWEGTWDGTTSDIGTT
jgi:hypothetical protein